MKSYLSTTRDLLALFFFTTVCSYYHSQTQLPECEAEVPFFILDLSSDPDSTYTTPEIVRTGQCCNDDNNQNYVSFYVTLHPDVAMVEIGIAPGYADPGGSGFYNIVSGGDINTPGVCGTNIAGGQTACITGSGPHKITYHKPGGNKVKYYLRQIPRPIFPVDQATRVGCTLPLAIYGLNSITITSINSSTGNTTPGAYNSLLSCTNCSTPSFSPGLATPAWIDYRICGTPQASACGTFASCDTVRLYTYSALGVNATPSPAQFCAGGSGVLLTAAGFGGDGNYSYIWRNSLGAVVSTSATYNASAAGTYTVEINDGLSTATCPSEFVSVPVSVISLPVTNAGIDQTICATNPTVSLHGSVLNASGGVWSNGSGTFNPGPTSLLATYTATSTEINTGFVDLILTSTGGGGGCLNDKDTVRIFFSDTIKINPTSGSILCNGNTTTVNANASGGTPPYLYLWGTGATTSSTTVSAGTYTIIVTDSYGCFQAGSTTVSQPSAMTLNMSSTNTSTDVSCDGSASVSVSGGTAPYSYLWSNGQTTSSTSSTLCYGIITVTITDANGCVINGSTVVNKPSCSLFNVTATGTDVNCYGGMDGTAQSFPVGGSSPYSYTWNSAPPQNTQNASNLGAGTYTVTVTDNLGCIDVASVTILQPTVITNTMTHTDVTIVGGSNGTATANPSGGTPNYTYLWTPNGQTTQTSTGLSAGPSGTVYYVTITDDNSCIKEDSVLINQPPCNNFQVAVNTTPTLCFGNSNGAATLVIGDGTGPYSINWSTGASNVMSINGLAAGNYSVTVTDATNCSTFQSFTITQPDPLSLGLVPTNITCFGLQDGTIDLTVSGGSAPVTYLWMMGSKVIANHEDLMNLEPGTYSVTVTDVNGCVASGSAGISQPTPLGATNTYVDILCNSFATGSINANPLGGMVPYTYSWTGPSGFTSTSQDISGLAAGLYEFRFSDANGCDYGPMQVFINQPAEIITEVVDVPCPAPGSNTVTVTIDSISGGMGSTFQVSFNNGSTYLASGVYSTTLTVGSSYSILVRDVNGCVSPDAFVLNIDPNVTISSAVFNPCIPPSSSTVPATVTPSGGDGGPYQVSTDGGVSWNPSGQYVVNVNVGGSNNIIVRDSKGCMSTTTVAVVPSELSASATMSNMVTCAGGSNGSANLTVTGGNAPFSYSWTGPSSFTANTEDISNLIAGTYNVTVTDNNGCSASTSVSITTVADVTPPVITCVSNQTVNSSSTSCTYTQSGTAWNATATDNCIVASVTYSLSGATTGTGTSLNGVVFNLGSTLVTWTATDGLGNTAVCTNTILVEDNTLPGISSCAGLGTQIVSANTGACNYLHSGIAWNAIVNDNCSVSSVVYTLTGATTGSGTSLNGVSFNPGTTTVTWTVTDNSSNTSTCSFQVIVEDNSFPVITNCPGNITVGSDLGECGANVNWTVPTFTDNCGATMVSTHSSGAFFGIGTTTVTYTVSDGAGNVSTCSFTVTVNDSELPQISCSANIASCDPLITFGTPAATDNCGISTLTQIAGLPSGSSFPVGTTVNTFEVVDIHGNVSTCSFNVIIHPVPLLSLTYQDVTCNGTGDASIDLSVSNGTAPYSFLWSNSAITEDISGLSPGNYSVIVSDDNNCTATITQDIIQPQTLLLSVESSDVSCNGGSDGSIDLTIGGGTLPYVFDWSNGQTTEDLSGLTAGNYNATINDANGCSVIFNGTINQPDALLIQTSVYNATCNAPNGSIQAQVTGGTTPYIYSWSDGSDEVNLNNVVAGDYVLTVTDVQGCIATYSGTIESVSNIQGIVFVDQILCHGDSTGAIEIFMESGNAPYTYAWSDGSSDSINADLPAGAYSVTVTDDFGCQATFNIDLIQPDPLLVTLSPSIFPGGTNIGEFDGSDGWITCSVTGGTEAYAYVWSNGGTENAIYNLNAGNYSVVVTDNNGCVAYASSRLTEPLELDMPEGFSPNGDDNNEIFDIHGIAAYPDNELTIFNRWGNIVYQKKNYANEWIGENANGEALPDGTYFAILNVFGPKEITLTGYVDLRR